MTELSVNETLGLISGLKIPPAPVILQKLHTELQKDEPEVQKVANIIAEDVGLSALVLKTVNAPVFGLKTSVRSIQHATSLLGLSNTINIVAGLALMQSLGGSGNDEKMWDSALLTARYSAGLAQKFPNVTADEAYMLGLFHNAGEILMRQNFEQFQHFRLNLPPEGVDNLTELEQQGFKTDHAVVGYYLARTWGLDLPVCQAIRDHHDVPRRLQESVRTDPEEREKMMLCVLKMAEQMERIEATGKSDAEWDMIRDDVLAYVGLSEPDFHDLTDSLSEIIQAA